jgi:MFS family permease
MRQAPTDLPITTIAAPSPIRVEATTSPLQSRSAYLAAWGLCLVFYFLQYALRSAPGVMIPELTTAFNLTTLGVSSLLGLYYYTYAGFAIVAGASLDRFGANFPIVIGVITVAAGSALFGLGSAGAAESGRLLQGAGSAFAFTGAVYLAAHGFSAKWLATAVGFTQLAGMLGGFAGQFAVGPLVHGAIDWRQFWIYSGAALALLALLLLIMTPRQHEPAKGPLWSMFAPYKIVLSNPQSYLCGIIGGLLFMPTTIGDMIWGVPHLKLESGVTAAQAIMRSSMAPLGWVIGAPLLGYIADRIGLRKPVLFAGMAIMLVSGGAIAFLDQYIPPYIGGLLFGIGSGAAMIPYAMIKEANPDKVKGSATGAMNFLVFSFSAIFAPLFGLTLMRLAGGATPTLANFRQADLIWAAAVVISMILTLFLRETGAARRPAAVVAPDLAEQEPK